MTNETLGGKMNLTKTTSGRKQPDAVKPRFNVSANQLRGMKILSTSNLVASMAVSFFWSLTTFELHLPFAWLLDVPHWCNSERAALASTLLFEVFLLFTVDWFTFVKEDIRKRS